MTEQLTDGKEVVPREKKREEEREEERVRKRGKRVREGKREKGCQESPRCEMAGRSNIGHMIQISQLME